MVKVLSQDHLSSFCNTGVQAYHGLTKFWSSTLLSTNYRTVDMLKVQCCDVIGRKKFDSTIVCSNASVTEGTYMASALLLTKMFCKNHHAHWIWQPNSNFILLFLPIRKVLQAWSFFCFVFCFFAFSSSKTIQLVEKL